MCACMATGQMDLEESIFSGVALYFLPVLVALVLHILMCMPPKGTHTLSRLIAIHSRIQRGAQAALAMLQTFVWLIVRTSSTLEA